MEPGVITVLTERIRTVGRLLAVVAACPAVGGFHA